MKIAIASDHAGEEYRKKIINHFNTYNFLDLSPNNSPYDDYPDFAFKLGETIRDGKADIGILVCGTGIGMSIACNKVKGIRCAHITRVEDAEKAKTHNGANVIAFGSYLDINLVYDMVKKFVETTDKPEERHINRINKIIKYESGEYNEL